MRIINVNAGRHMGTHDQWLQQFETELQITPVNDGYKTTLLVNSHDNILTPALGRAKLVKQFKLGEIQNKTVSLGRIAGAAGTYMLVVYIDNIPQIQKIILK